MSKEKQERRVRDGSERNGDRSTAGAGHPDVLKRPPQATLYAPSVGARFGHGVSAQFFVNQLVKWDAQLQQDLDKMLEKAKAANERRYFDDDD
ncbi:hypothetical protein V6N11_060686 [Hibiscus sabdariffa]|uniref:Uncharacterized protein n=1 Tax=Hibiscus sabdariffa TaxID=183260 RepID=A0ABR2QR12_9ROSI